MAIELFVLVYGCRSAVREPLCSVVNCAMAFYEQKSP